MKRPALLLLLAAASIGWPDDDGVYGVYSLPDYTVNHSTGARPFEEWDFGGATVSAGAAVRPGQASMADVLMTLPGVEMNRRGAASLEPVIRGLGGGRVATFFNGLQLPGGSPTQLAPIGFFFPGAVATASVARALPTVTGGPVTLGGRIDLHRYESVRPRNSGRIQAEVGSGWEGLTFVGAGEAATSGTFGFSGAFSAAGFGDYRTGGGDWVDADFRMVGVAGSAGWLESEGRRTNLAFVLNHQFLVRNASLPLDLKDTVMGALTFETSWEAGRVAWVARAGYADTRPFLTSEDRPIAPGSPVRLVTAEGEAKSLGAGFAATVPWGGSAEVELGMDFGRQVRDSVRVRSLRTGASFRDHIWPEIETANLGAFAEVRWQVADRFRVTGGVRLDRRWSDALAADDPVVGLPGAKGSTIRENFASFNGPPGATTSRDDWGGAAQLSLELPIRIGESELTAFTGVGLVRAAPGESERYRAFLNALGGGMEVGNPSLDSETRSGLDLGLRLEARDWRWDFSGFVARVDGFVQREVIAAGPLVYGFRNRDVEMTGVELLTEWRPAWLELLGMAVDGSLAWVRAEDRSTSTELAGIPPWDVRVALAWENRGDGPDFRLRAEARVVGSATNPDPTLVPLYRDTDGFSLVDLHGRFDAGGGWEVGLSIANLFDRRYYEYLQVPVDNGALGPSSGTLEPGDPVPGMGRRVVLSFHRSF